MQNTTEWTDLLEQFKRFGGQAENIAQQNGPYGLGLFPIDSNEEVNLLVPKNLLVPADNIELEDGEVVIRDHNSFPKGYGEWFRRYQALFSWGAEGEASVTDFENGLQNLPVNVKSEMIKLGLYQPDQRMPCGNRRESILRRFLNCRCLVRKGQLLVMPILELVNHSPLAANWETHSDGNIGVSGRRGGEILVKYSNSDSMQRLMAYGFNCREPMAFSLHISVQHRGQSIKIQGGGGRRWFQSPMVKYKGDTLVIQQPLLGFSQGPKLAKSLFLMAFQDFSNVDATELFEQIHQANTLALVDLLRLLDKQTGETASQLRCGCLDQLLILSEHVGYRPELLLHDDGISATKDSNPTKRAFMG